jgi:hypothetical protein
VATQNASFANYFSLYMTAQVLRRLLNKRADVCGLSTLAFISYFVYKAEFQRVRAVVI